MNVPHQFALSKKAKFTFMAKLLPQPAYTQLKGFLPSWSPSTWLSKLKGRVNLFPQPSFGHSSCCCGFSPAWTRSPCWCRNHALLNSFLHSPHCTLTVGGIKLLYYSSSTHHLKKKKKGMQRTTLYTWVPLCSFLCCRYSVQVFPWKGQASCSHW